MSEVVYSTNEAAKIAGISGATVRNLTTGQFASHYSKLFTPGATPGEGQARHLTADDVKLLQFIRAATRSGLPHAEIAAKIRAGALEGWQAPKPGEAAPQEPPRRSHAEAQLEGAQAAALALVNRVGDGLVVAMQLELESARTEARELRERVTQSETARAAAEARAQELAAELARARRPFWRRWFGG